MMMVLLINMDWCGILQNLFSMFPGSEDSENGLSMMTVHRIWIQNQMKMHLHLLNRFGMNTELFRKSVTMRLPMHYSRQEEQP